MEIWGNGVVESCSAALDVGGLVGSDKGGSSLGVTVTLVYGELGMKVEVRLGKELVCSGTPSSLHPHPTHLTMTLIGDGQWKYCRRARKAQLQRAEEAVSK